MHTTMMLAEAGNFGSVQQCSCGCVHLRVGSVTLYLARTGDLRGLVQRLKRCPEPACSEHPIQIPLGRVRLTLTLAEFTQFQRMVQEACAASLIPTAELPTLTVENGATRDCYFAVSPGRSSSSIREEER